jgi:hypothetical protein
VKRTLNSDGRPTSPRRSLGSTRRSPAIKPTLDQAAARLDRQQAASNAVIDHGLQQQRNARNFGDYLKAYRDKIDGVPSAGDIRRAATIAEPHRGPARLRAPQMPIIRQAGLDL